MTGALTGVLAVALLLLGALVPCGCMRCTRPAAHTTAPRYCATGPCVAGHHLGMHQPQVALSSACNGREQAPSLPFPMPPPTAPTARCTPPGPPGPPTKRIEQIVDRGKWCGRRGGLLWRGQPQAWRGQEPLAGCGMCVCCGPCLLLDLSPEVQRLGPHCVLRGPQSRGGSSPAGASRVEHFPRTTEPTSAQTPSAAALTHHHYHHHHKQPAMQRNG